jgi:hypothetical protein
MKISVGQQRQLLVGGLKPLRGLEFRALMAHPAIEYPGLEIRGARIFDGSRRNVRNIRYAPGAGGWSGEVTLYGRTIKISLPTQKLKTQDDPTWERY